MYILYIYIYIENMLHPYVVTIDIDINSVSLFDPEPGPDPWRLETRCSSMYIRCVARVARCAAYRFFMWSCCSRSLSRTSIVSFPEKFREKLMISWCLDILEYIGYAGRFPKIWTDFERSGHCKQSITATTNSMISASGRGLFGSLASEICRLYSQKNYPFRLSPWIFWAFQHFSIFVSVQRMSKGCLMFFSDFVTPKCWPKAAIRSVRCGAKFLGVHYHGWWLLYDTLKWSAVRKNLDIVW